MLDVPFVMIAARKKVLSLLEIKTQCTEHWSDDITAFPRF